MQIGITCTIKKKWKATISLELKKKYSTKYKLNKKNNLSITFTSNVKKFKINKCYFYRFIHQDWWLQMLTSWLFLQKLSFQIRPFLSRLYGRFKHNIKKNLYVRSILKVSNTMNHAPWILMVTWIFYGCCGGLCKKMDIRMWEWCVKALSSLVSKHM